MKANRGIERTNKKKETRAIREEWKRKIKTLEKRVEEGTMQ